MDVKIYVGLDTDAPKMLHPENRELTEDAARAVRPNVIAVLGGSNSYGIFLTKSMLRIGQIDVPEGTRYGEQWGFIAENLSKLLPDDFEGDAVVTMV